MNTSTSRILALAAMSMAMTAWAIPPPVFQNSGGANATAENGTQSLTDGNLAFMEPAPNASPEPSLASPADFEPKASAPNTRELIESSAAAKNGETHDGPIPKMPAYTVTGAKVPVFRQRDISTKEGMEAVSFKMHPGLYVGDAFNLNASAAHEMFLEDDWRSTKRDYSDMARAMAYGGDPAEGRMIIQAVRNEDMEMRAQSESTGLPAFDRTQLGHLDGDSKLLQAPEDPVDIPFVKVKW